MAEPENDPLTNLSVDQLSSLSTSISYLKNEYQVNTLMERQKEIDDIKLTIGEVPDEIIDWALEICNGDDKETIRRIQGEPGFFQALKSKYEGQEINLDEWKAYRPSVISEPTDDSDSDVVIESYTKDSKHRKKRSARSSCPVPGSSSPPASKRPRQGSRTRSAVEYVAASKRDVNLPRLTLNEAMIKLEEIQSPGESGRSEKKLSARDLTSLGWSEARIKAYLNKDKNPNAYYYRFLDVGCTQATGEWTKEEKRIFFDNVRRIGVDYQWGLFSRNIPNRVGYQCSNYYRALIVKGEIHDDNYYFDSKGTLRFKFKGRSATDTDGGSGSKLKSRLRVSPREIALGPQQIRKSRKTFNESSSSSSQVSSDGEMSDANDSTETDDASSPPRFKSKTRGGAPATSVDENREFSRIKHLGEDIEELLPGMKDPITFLPMLYPAISPYGHVMEYDSWIRVLAKEPMNTCPFTKKKLTRRMLTKLNEDNIEEFRSKIVQM